MTHTQLHNLRLIISGQTNVEPLIWASLQEANLKLSLIERCQKYSDTGESSDREKFEA